MSDKPHPKVFRCSESPGTGLQIPHSGCFDSEALKKVLPRPGVLPLLIPCARCVCALKRFWQACDGGSVRREPERNCADRQDVSNLFAATGATTSGGYDPWGMGLAGAGVKARAEGSGSQPCTAPSSQQPPPPPRDGCLELCLQVESLVTTRGEQPRVEVILPRCS